MPGQPGAVRREVTARRSSHRDRDRTQAVANAPMRDGLRPRARTTSRRLRQCERPASCHGPSTSVGGVSQSRASCRRGQSCRAHAHEPEAESGPQSGPGHGRGVHQRVSHEGQISEPEATESHCVDVAAPARAGRQGRRRAWRTGPPGPAAWAQSGRGRRLGPVPLASWPCAPSSSLASGSSGGWPTSRSGTAADRAS